MLVIELDGFTHSFDDVYQKDLIKEAVLKELGITILRFNDSEVMNNLPKHHTRHRILYRNPEQIAKDIPFPSGEPCLKIIKQWRGRAAALVRRRGVST